MADGIRLIFENLLKAFSSGKDLAARANMMRSVATGAVAFRRTRSCLRYTI